MSRRLKILIDSVGAKILAVIDCTTDDIVEYAMSMEIRVDPQQLRRTLEAIVGERSPFSSQRHLAAVESFIEKELGSYGLSVESDYFSYRGKNFRNIVGRSSAQRGAIIDYLGSPF